MKLSGHEQSTSMREWILTQLGLNPDLATPYEMFRAADAVHQGIGILLLSVVDCSGDLPLSPAAKAVLDRQRRRLHLLDSYADTALMDAPTGRVVKGSTIRRTYETGLCRSQTDVDLVFSNPSDLWHAAVRLQRTDEFDDPKLVVIGSDLTKVCLQFSRPAPDVFFDKPILVELAPTPFYGDGGSVRTRYDLPSDPLLLSFMAICEERFQRKFHMRDGLDMNRLVSALSKEMPSWEEACVENARVLRLAPELLELWEYARSMSLAADPPTELRHLADMEAQSRGEKDTALLPPDLRGLFVGGAINEDPESFTVIGTRGSKRAVRTPVGCFILTESDTVTEDEVRWAREIAGAGSSAPSISGRRT